MTEVGDVPAEAMHAVDHAFEQLERLDAMRLELCFCDDGAIELRDARGSTVRKLTPSDALDIIDPR